MTIAHFVREFNNTTPYTLLILEFTYRKNTPTDINIGMGNSAVMRLKETCGKFRQGVTYFVRDITLGPTVAEIYRLFPRRSTATE